MAQLFSHIRRLLEKSHDCHEAQTLTFMLLEDVCGLSRTDVLIGRDDELSDGEKMKIREMADRVAGGEPLQYVTGRAEFDGLNLNVASGVLIPRPETAELVERVAENCDENGRIIILDLCSGSGCIGLALKNRFPLSEVHGLEVSCDALHIAIDNARSLGLNVEFHRCNLLNEEEWNSGVLAELEGRVDVIVSNPPYICDSEQKDMEQTVLDHEPHLALFVPDDNPLLFYSIITRHAYKLLKTGGMLAFEINRRFADEVCELLRNDGFHDVEAVMDQFDNERIVTGRR